MMQALAGVWHGRAEPQTHQHVCGHAEPHMECHCSSSTPDQLVPCLCINKHVHTRLQAGHLQYGMLASHGQQQPWFSGGAAMRVCPALM
jgi:hypothetical protein